MTKVRDIYAHLCQLAPLDLQMKFDNSGFQIGHEEDEVQRVLLALDVTDAVVEEAIACKAELIISHHPLLFHAPRSITDRDPETARILRLAEHRIAVISMHTNLDIAGGGVNDVLIRLLGAEPERVLDDDGCGRIGTLAKPMDLDSFLQLCREVLHVAGLRYAASGRPVHHLAVMGGSGGDSLETACALGCDTYVTADVKYHQFLRAQELGINLIDADHFCTENPVIYDLKDRLSEVFPSVRFDISSRHGPVIEFA
ncbi:MAG: Nif3-like dinuclear metal center hexameric protein [Oscillospiraceae bacterium]|nr:Nif3-like dinuclear metal center hexameric protein [Oscillospiraceae bacterium]